MMVYIEMILSKIKYLDWTFELDSKHTAWSDTQTRETSHMIRVKFNAPDNDNPSNTTEQYGRWWVLPDNFTESDVIRTAWKAIECAVIHEAQEQFTYKGVRVLDPHRDLTIVVEKI